MNFSDIINEAYGPSEYPALSFLADRWVVSQPFAGLKILVATPIFRNTLVQYRTLMAGGAELYVGYAEDPSGVSKLFDKNMVRYLKESDVPVVTAEDIREGRVADDFDIILDCAGNFSFCHPKKGFVELTRSGVKFYKDSKFPVYVADSGIVKRIETVLGTGDGYFRGLEKFGFTQFEGKNLVVFGSGKVGCGIALQGVHHGMNVCSITDTHNEDPDTNFSKVLTNNGVRIEEYTDDVAVTEVIASADFLVTATGVRNSLTWPAVSALMSNLKVVVANMGVEDEFGAFVPKNRVLNEKAPLNFFLDEPTNLKYIDASLALHAALGECLLQNGTDGEPAFTGLRNPPSEIEQQLLIVTIQNGAIGQEICDMMR